MSDTKTGLVDSNGVADTSHVGAEQLMTLAAAGRLTKPVMAALLAQGARQRFLESCAHIERRYTDACAAKGDPCLESGCSLEGGDEICLQPLLEAGDEYNRACAAEWVKLFQQPENRLGV